MKRPLVLVTACRRDLSHVAVNTVQLKYLEAVTIGAGCMPLILPALGESADLDAVLDAVDGVMLTGSPSNVDPALYGQALLDPSRPQDHRRDATTLPLIRRVLERDIPLFAICRGFQEMNVALGGSLHQAVHAVGGMQDHRNDHDLTLEQQYAPAHPVWLEPRGRLAAILGASSVEVNSLHEQGIDRLGDGLQVEARASDGLIEAFSVKGARFAMGVQWHPEWQIASNPVGLRLLGAFGEACQQQR
jgi:putative glutamine amidotransferase